MTILAFLRISDTKNKFFANYGGIMPKFQLSLSHHHLMFSNLTKIYEKRVCRGEESHFENFSWEIIFGKHQKILTLPGGGTDPVWHYAFDAFYHFTLTTFYNSILVHKFNINKSNNIIFRYSWFLMKKN